MAIAVEDDYISNRLMKEIKDGVLESKVVLDKEVVLEYFKWITYYPKWFIRNLNTIKLFNEERYKQILDFIVTSKIYENDFRKYLKGNKSPMVIYKIYNYMESISIHNIANIKLSHKEYEYCLEVLKSYSNNSVEVFQGLVSDFMKKKNRSMMEEYLLHCFKELVNICYAEEEEKVCLKILS